MRQISWGQLCEVDADLEALVGSHGKPFNIEWNPLKRITAWHKENESKVLKAEDFFLNFLSF